MAEFIQRNHDQLDKAAIGEYFGHHEELQIRVMHAFVDLQRFQGLTIDVALRNLMDEFRWGGGLGCRGRAVQLVLRACQAGCIAARAQVGGRRKVVGCGACAVQLALLRAVRAVLQYVCCAYNGSTSTSTKRSAYAGI